MTLEELIAEGRLLQRPCMVLRPVGEGPVAAVWYERDIAESERTGYRCWLTIDSRQIIGLPPSVSGYLSIFTDERKCRSGYIEVSSYWPERSGTRLYAHAAAVLPPIDAVFARGSDVVGKWIGSHGWDREERYNSNFNDAGQADEYEQLWVNEFPLCSASDIYAVIGGWHLPSADDDWHDLIDEQLMVLTARDAEPWVEAWYKRSGKFEVIQRIT